MTEGVGKRILHKRLFTHQRTLTQLEQAAFGRKEPSPAMAAEIDLLMTFLRQDSDTADERLREVFAPTLARAKRLQRAWLAGLHPASVELEALEKTDAMLGRVGAALTLENPDRKAVDLLAQNAGQRLEANARRLEEAKDKRLDDEGKQVVADLRDTGELLRAAIARLVSAGSST